MTGATSWVGMACAAGTARSLALTPGSAKWRARMPVRTSAPTVQASPRPNIAARATARVTVDPAGPVAVTCTGPESCSTPGAVTAYCAPLAAAVVAADAVRAVWHPVLLGRVEIYLAVVPGVAWFAVLLELVNRGPTEQRVLVEATGSDKSAIMRVIDDLENKGLAVRKPVPGDRRVRAVEITRKGLELFDAAHVAAEPLAEQLVSTLRPGEVEQLKRLLIRFSPQPES